jgi:hypothetical protein
MENNEVDKFFANLPTENKSEADIFGEPKAPIIEPEKDTGEEVLKNRRERRLAEKLNSEREMAIALNERVKVLSEQVTSLTAQQQYVKEHEGEIDPRLLRAFGSTPEGTELGKIFQDILKDTAEQAKADALREFEETQRQRTAEIQKEQSVNENYIQQELEALEEEHNVDLTSNTPNANKARKEFLSLVEKLSPKDSNGSIKEYADFGTAFEIYKGSQKSEPNRAKELSARSMQNSSAGTAPAPTRPMTFKEAGRQIERLFGNN